MAERCFIHSDRESFAPCHSCGKYFCEECLMEGEEYYYCREEHCQTLKAEEMDRLRLAKERKERDSDLIKQKWKEKTRRFYRKTPIALGFVWVWLTVVLFIFVAHLDLQKLYVVLLLSLFGCIKGFIVVWLLRNIFYKPFWEWWISRDETARRKTVDAAKQNLLRIVEKMGPR